MGKYSRQEIEDAFKNYTAVPRATSEADLPGKKWYDRWAEFFTEDAIYIEHVVGVFRGRDQIRAWIAEACEAPARGLYWTAYPCVWYVIDEERGWIIAYFQNRMQDLGNGDVYEEPNVSILHYAGEGQFSYQEDVYNPYHMIENMKRWTWAKAGLEEDKDTPAYKIRTARAEAHTEASRRTGHKTV